MGDTEPGVWGLHKLLPFAQELDPGDLVGVELLRGDVPLGFDEPKNLLHPNGPWESEQLPQARHFAFFNIHLHHFNNISSVAFHHLRHVKHSTDLRKIESERQ